MIHVSIIEGSYVRKVCKIGKGVDCCSYLSIAKQGFCCMKNDPADKANIDEKRNSGSFRAMGDNCPGYGVK